MKAINGSVVTIGVFDGVHKGHKIVIEKVVDAARKSGLSSIVVTFDPHPVKVLNPGYKIPSLISLKHRMKLIKELGVDLLLVIKFTKSFSKMPPDKFVDNVLIGKLHARHIYVGENFYFGSGAGAGAQTLRMLSKRRGLKVTTVKSVKSSGHIVSSSLIRKLILLGKLSEATKLLGRPVSVLGTVVKGSGLARKLGCPTANINPHHEVIPPRGVYAVWAKFGDKIFPGILNIGFRPTFYSSKDKEPTIEVHLFGFRGNLYGRDAEVYFVKKLRDERKFSSKEALIRQIAKDVDRTHKILYKRS